MKLTILILLALLALKMEFTPGVLAQENSTTTESPPAEAVGEETTSSFETTTTTSSDDDDGDDDDDGGRPLGGRVPTGYCDRNCVVEALSGDSDEGLPDRCEDWCPEYILPEEALDPNAVCTRCQDETCPGCSCDSGECLETADPQILSTDDSGYSNFVAGGSSVNSFVCASCSPRRSCRRFWWC